MRVLCEEFGKKVSRVFFDTKKKKAAFVPRVSVCSVEEETTTTTRTRTRMKTVVVVANAGAATTTTRSSKGETEPLLVAVKNDEDYLFKGNEKGRAGTTTTTTTAMCLLVAALVVSGAAALTKTTTTTTIRAEDVRTTRAVSSARLGTMSTLEDAKTFTLHTGCSQLEKVMPMVRKRFRTNENNNDANDFDDFDDDDDAQYDWSRKIGAKLVLKDDDENAGGETILASRKAS